MNETHSCNAWCWHLCVVFGARLTFCILIIIGKVQSACLWEMFKKGTTLQVWGIHHHRQGGVEAQPHAGSTPSLAHVSKSFQPDARRAWTEMGSMAWGELVPYLKMVSVHIIFFPVPFSPRVQFPKYVMVAGEGQRQSPHRSASFPNPCWPHLRIMLHFMEEPGSNLDFVYSTAIWNLICKMGHALALSP